MAELEKGSQFPFAILHKVNNNVIGSTRFLDIQFKHRKLEIGTTWVHPKYWSTAVNLECKLLLLTFCFETLQALRVQLKTDENNLRSQKAIEKIERQFDGIIRNDMLRDNNTRRNSAGLQYYCPGMEREKNKADFPYCKISSMPAANKGIALVNRSFRSGRYNPQF